jgi:hypothetical protein
MKSWFVSPISQSYNIEAPCRFSLGGVMEKSNSQALVCFKKIGRKLIFISQGKKRHG